MMIHLHYYAMVEKWRMTGIGGYFSEPMKEPVVFIVV